jgi:hypothetical protein
MMPAVLAALKECRKFREIRLVPVDEIYWIPVTVVAPEEAVLLNVWIVFCETVLLTEELTKAIPTTEAAVVVPVPPAAVRFRIVLLVNVPSEVDEKIPTTWEPVAVVVL